MGKNICSECAGCRGLSCCEDVQIYITRGDIERITSYTNSEDFYFAAPLNGVYRNCDSTWKDLVLDKNGCRNIIKLKKNGKCVFLKKNGCLLPMTVKPLLCRIHPYEFNEDGIFGIYKYCPISKMPNSEEILKDMGMSYKIVKKWHAILYREIRKEKRSTLNEE